MKKTTYFCDICGLPIKENKDSHVVHITITPSYYYTPQPIRREKDVCESCVKKIKVLMGLENE